MTITPNINKTLYYAEHEGHEEYGSNHYYALRNWLYQHGEKFGIDDSLILL